MLLCWLKSQRSRKNIFNETAENYLKKQNIKTYFVYKVPLVFNITTTSDAAFEA